MRRLLLILGGLGLLAGLARLVLRPSPESEQGDGEQEPEDHQEDDREAPNEVQPREVSRYRLLAIVLRVVGPLGVFLLLSYQLFAISGTAVVEAPDGGKLILIVPPNVYSAKILITTEFDDESLVDRLSGREYRDLTYLLVTIEMEAAGEDTSIESKCMPFAVSYFHGAGRQEVWESPALTACPSADPDSGSIRYRRDSYEIPASNGLARKSGAKVAVGTPEIDAIPLPFAASGLPVRDVGVRNSGVLTMVQGELRIEGDDDLKIEHGVNPPKEMALSWSNDLNRITTKSWNVLPQSKVYLTAIGEDSFASKSLFVSGVLAGIVGGFFPSVVPAIRRRLASARQSNGGQV